MSFPVDVDQDWCSYIFGESGAPEIGQRLGIQYVKASQSTISVSYGDVEVQFHQESMGLMAISGVVWDAGLFMVDFLQQLRSEVNADQERSYLGDQVLDIGCGTGIAGISALMTGTKKVIFTDMERLACFDLNIELLPKQFQDTIQFEPYKWTDGPLPEIFIDPLLSSATPEDCTGTDPSERVAFVWNTVLCSDLLYEEKSHTPLLSVLRKLRFEKAIFAYKKRHDQPEKVFFQQLSEWCTLRVVDPSCVRLVNLPRSSLPGLYLVIAEPIV